MKNIIYLFIINSFIYSQCEYDNELSCNFNQDCDWIEDISEESCYYTFSSYSECIANGCSWYSPGSYGYMGAHCYGSYSVDNSYCEEIQMPTCSDMDMLQCTSNYDCEWIEDIEWGNCGDYNSSWSCDNAHDQCGWTLCYGGGYGEWNYCCTGGAFQTDNSYCEESDYIYGDLNGDSSVNILDIIETVNLIMDGGYDITVDMDSNNEINILDIIQIIGIILDS